MYNIAVLITVFNRRETTINGLHSLNDAISYLGGERHFDIYLTDDGCTDGTADAILKEFPQVIIVKGTGSLFWGGGMNYAWYAAIDSNVQYDYYLWYNDDSYLYKDALKILFSVAQKETVITGAFRDKFDNVSYGGKTKDNILIEPNGECQPVYYMNGNLVLIPRIVYERLGIIDKRLIHGGGDFEYGIRARKNGFSVALTPAYVGVANRHHEEIPKCCSSEYGFKRRFQLLKSPIYNPRLHFYYNTIAHGYIRAIINYCLGYLGALSPRLYYFLKLKIKKSNV